jgi:spermidine/putrescine transport system permease protein
MASLRENLRSDVDRISKGVELGKFGDVVQPPWILMVPITLLYLLLFFGSMLAIVVLSLQPENTINLTTWTLDNFETVLTSETYLPILYSTLEISLITTVLTLLFSYPAAYALARKIERFHLLILLALIVPLFTGINVRVFGWFLFLTEGGIVTSLLNTVGITEVPQLMFRKWTIILGTTYVYMPFMLFPIYLSILTIPDSLFVAANDLGASKLRVFRSLVLPLSFPGVMIGALFVFILTLGASVEAQLLGGGRVITMGSNIEYSFGYLQQWTIGSAQAIGLLLVSIAAGVIIIRTIDFETIAGRE